MWSQLLLLALFFCASLVASQEDIETERAPRIILYKFTPTNPVVENKDFVITYQLINNGNAPAVKVEIVDNYDVNSFDIVDNVGADGFVSQRFEELPPHGQVSFNVTVKPKLFGVYESTRARIRYVNGALQPEEHEDEKPDYRLGTSSSLGRTRIFSAAEYERLTSSFVKEWAILAVICLLPVVLPLRLYWQARDQLRPLRTSTTSAKSD